VWQQSCQQLYLPRLKDDTVFQNTMAMGAESQDFFGIAQGKEESRYVGFSLGKCASLILDSALLLIDPAAAASYAEAQRAADEAARSTPVDLTTSDTSDKLQRAEDSGKSQTYPTSDAAAPQPVKKQFYASIELDAIQAKKQFADLVDEVVLQFTSQPGVRVKIAIEIQAESGIGFDAGIQRVVKENCNVLRFKTAEFE
jgi:hypothetical protein